MRFDNIGMFWEDRPTGKAGRAARSQPPIPDTGWTTPTDFPNLSAARALAIDVETYDPEMKEYGPGWGRGRGHLCGISIAVEDGSSWYFPMRHSVEPEHNLDPDKVLRWADYVLRPDIPKIGANLIYDIGWLNWEGVRVGGALYDVLFAEALLDSENPSLGGLDGVSQKYLGLSKVKSLLYKWCDDYYGVREDQRLNIHRAPPRLVGPYAEADAALPFAIMNKQWPILAERGCLDIFQVECDLIPLLIEMRMQGVPVNIEKAAAFGDKLAAKSSGILDQIKDFTGRAISPYSAADLAWAFDNSGVPYPRTPTGKPQFVKAWLERHEHPLPKLITEYRQNEKLRSVFIQGYILDSNVDGRIYCSFHPLKGDEGGARSGRFSSSTPNLQNIPVRTAEGKMIRSSFEAPGATNWEKFDYSQIEYRLLAHYAVGPGSNEVRERYLKDPSTDYHELTIALIKERTGLEVDRRPAKNINFGLVYGMSKKGVIRYLGVPQQIGEQLYRAYHEAAPFVKKTIEATEGEVALSGSVTTILGRRSDFNLWMPASYSAEDTNKPLPLEKALLVYPSVQRAFLHKALNRKLQGSAADIIKKAMVEAYKSGVFRETGIPFLTVHDELDFGGRDVSPESWDKLKEVMTQSVRLRVPLMVDMTTGRNWGECA